MTRNRDMFQRHAGEDQSDEQQSQAPLQGSTGLLRLVIDRPNSKFVDVVLSADEGEPLNLEIAETEVPANRHTEESIILRGNEIAMLRDLLNCPIVSAWLE
jgi:hypothetical protein